MARIAIIGASIGGLPAAYEARALLDKQHKVSVISNVDSFHFVPSNPWVAVGWRTRKDISFAVGPVLEKKGIEFIHATADRIEPAKVSWISPISGRLLLVNRRGIRVLVASVEELAAMVAWLASSDNSFTTGAVFDISGGRATY